MKALASRSRLPLVYDWSRLKVGEAAFFPNDGEQRGSYLRNRMAVSARDWCKRNAPHLRPASVQCEGGVKVWLIEK